MDELPKLETECERCRGSGRISDGYGFSDPCRKCRGLGFIPTDAGIKIIDLMRRHLRSPLFDDR